MCRRRRVDRQMKRYRVPRLAFINKMDRFGANPFKVIQALRDQLQLNPALLQYPISIEDNFEGVIDNSVVKYDGVVEKARRSSIWTRSSQGWVLRFHQGTPFE